MSFSVPTEFPTSGGNFEPIPIENHIGVCIGVIELGTHMESYQGGPMKPVRKLKLQFELPDVQRGDGKAAVINRKFNLSLHEKATFRKVIDAWLGSDWTQKYKGQSWRFLLGLPAMVDVDTFSDTPASEGKRMIKSLSKLHKSMTPPKPTRELFFLDLSEKVLPANLSAWDAEMIRRSQEYQSGGFEDHAPTPDQRQAYEPAATMAPPKLPGRPSSVRTEIQQYPADVQRLMAKYTLEPGYSTSDLDEKADIIGIPKAEYETLRTESVPF